jgi:hypothetical protein
MDYREGARRIISLEEAANRTRLEASKTLTEETTARIRERMEGAKQRREGLIADFDQLRLPDRLIALNSQVWSGLGRVDTVTEDLPTPNRAYIRRHVLSAGIPLYVPDTTPVTRPGIVHIHRSGGERYFNQDNQEFGGWFKCYKVPGMKKVADRIVGAQVGHTETTALTIEIEAPTVPKNEGDRIKLRIEDTEYKYRSILNDVVEDKDGVLTDVGLDELPYSVSRLGRGYLSIPPFEYDLAVISKFIDAALIIASIPRLKNPLSDRMAQAETERAGILKRVGGEIPYHSDTVI